MRNEAAGRLTKLMAALAAMAAMAGPAAAEAPAATCSKAAVAAAGDAVRRARSELNAIPIEAMETSVSPEAGRLIERVKDALRAFVRAEMACAPPDSVPAALAARMGASGDAFVDERPYDPDHPRPARHGGALLYEVKPVPGHPDLLAVVATLGIECGSDSMLMLYRRGGEGWSELMVRRSEPYSQVNGAWEDLRFAVSPPGRDGRWFVATVSITPWCTSAWLGLRYALARPGAEADRPTVFLAGKTVTWIGGDEDMVVRAERDAFELRHRAGILDPGLHNRRHVRRYAVRGETAVRVQPVAENVRDFADEWIDSSWDEAMAWSGPDPALAAAHARLREERWEPIDGFGPIRACGRGLTQIELTAGKAPSWFLLVRGGARGPWTMEQAGRRARAGCEGRSLP